MISVESYASMPPTACTSERRTQAMRADACAPTTNTQRAPAVLDKLLAKGEGR